MLGAGGLDGFAQMRQAGCNTMRLWSTDYAAPLLDEAQKQGLTVMLGLWLEPEDQHFTYYDPEMVRAQRQRVRQQVLRYRHHPALLMWSIGNEVEQSATGPRLFGAVNEIARMIHELDPYHPVTTALASDFEWRARQLQRLAPEIDVLSVNVYGKLRMLPQLIRKSGWQGPYIVSEYGAPGYWEAPKTPWEAPLEQNSTEKAESVGQAYRKSILADSSYCLGSYAFYWGSKFEYTPTWLSLFEPTGEKTALVDELTWLWSRRRPANAAPRLNAVLLAGRQAASSVQLPGGQEVMASVDATDPEGDSLTTRWEVRPEMELTFKTEVVATPTEVLPGCIRRAWGRQALVRTPSRPGAYRLYVRVFDGHGSVATANIPFLVRRKTPAAVVAK
ncbi:glycoside hydrolase family 2 TIM barrel-domain containing protein [Hymenobacter cheonanensis]|uniref:glycoside hydrolase family 2 TIM barrel-domain containing protein n=1 Tax=Hymenobacter sp. CA2-7 TaxID=3063993 RepID=UPI002712D947|nr:glycoside hydrolase family 2 TIM barrel-domain containing protein [Hymenobacter sp. CA2-7]MDO7884487.1 glycoside hydrolase family 2 TIM barrel-domain containing protein [Hymenobacter sp. CA2-7]